MAARATLAAHLKPEEWKCGGKDHFGTAPACPGKKPSKDSKAKEEKKKKKKEKEKKESSSKEDKKKKKKTK